MLNRLNMQSQAGKFLKRVTLSLALGLTLSTFLPSTVSRVAALPPAETSVSTTTTSTTGQAKADLPILALSASTEATRIGQKKAVYDSVKAGDPVTLQVEFFNGSKLPLSKVTVTLPTDDDKLPLAPTPSASKEDVSFNIGAGAKALINLNLIATKDLAAGSYNLTLNLQAEGYNSTSVPVTLTVLQKDVQQADLPGGPTATDKSDSKGNGSKSSDLQGQMSGPGSLDFMPMGSGGALDGGWSGVGMDSAGGRTGSESVKNKPKLIISNYKLNPEMAEAGQEFKLDLTFSNTNNKKEVRNIKITVNGEAGPATGRSAGQGDAGNTNANLQTGSVFSPVDSSNTFFIESIPAKGESEKSITLKVLPNAAAQNYVMNILFEYEDAEGNEFNATEMIGIPVVQQAKMEAGEVHLDPLAAGVPGAINLDFFNIGKDSLSTFMVTLEGQGFTTEGDRYFLGNFAPGQSDHFSTMITADEPGPLKGEIVFTFEDSAGKKHRETVPFETVVEEGIPDSSEDPGMIDQENSGQSGLVTTVIIVCALAAGLITFLILRHRKKQKSKKDLVIHD